MSEAGENSDEEYYAEESFEEDSQSEVEEQDPEEEEEEVEDEEDDEENIEQEVPDQSVGRLLEESDTQSESDAEAEFLRGNPHARRQLAARSTGGFNRMASYMSSSSEDESQVVVTKTVAEVNQLSLRLDTPLDDETPSVRTLMPGSAHSPAKDEIEDDEEDEDAEVEEVEEEDELQENEDGAQSDGTMESNDGRQFAEGSDEDEDTDVEVEQLEEDEPLVTAVLKQTVQETIQLPQEDIVSLVDASDNSSEHSVTTMGVPGDETDMTLAYDSPRFQKKQPETETETETVIERTETEEDQIDEPIKSLHKLVNDDNTSLSQQTDMARVRYLEQQMTQMSEMIMKSFQINGGTTNSQAFEQLAMATELMQQRRDRREDTESEMPSMTESAMTSARSLGGGRPPIRMRMQRSQEALITTRSSKLIRPKCRCPSESDLLQQERELEMGQVLGQSLNANTGLGMEMDEGYLVDECGQGDGLMRHPQQRRPQELNRRANSGTPSSFNSDGCEYPINVSRSRCSNDKINYKNLGRKSYSFTNPQLREIERQNQILLRKMMTVKPTATIKASTSSLKFNAPEKQRQQQPAPRLSSAAVNRKKFQRQIDLDNDLLKRKLEAIGTRRPQFK
uniref:Protein hemingway isoform X1 n=1 Tax=Drosophila rhopaloa TaxID=1041015 RepID=A0A6P4FQY3_DRORH